MALGRQLTKQGWLLLKKTTTWGLLTFFLVEIDYFVISFTSCRSVQPSTSDTDEYKFVEACQDFSSCSILLQSARIVYTPPMFRP